MTISCPNRCSMLLRLRTTSIIRSILVALMSMILGMFCGCIILWRSLRLCLWMRCIIGKRLMCFWLVNPLLIWLILVTSVGSLLIKSVIIFSNLTGIIGSNSLGPNSPTAILLLINTPSTKPVWTRWILSLENSTLAT